MAKPKKRAKESRLVYVPFVAAAVIVALVVVLAFVKPPPTNTAQTNGSFPFLQFVKVSDRDYASSPNTVEVYLVSWEGCPKDHVVGPLPLRPILPLELPGFPYLPRQSYATVESPFLVLT